MADENVIQIGQEAPNFTLKSNNGVSVNLSEFLGQQNVVLNFMREFT